MLWVKNSQLIQTLDGFKRGVYNSINMAEADGPEEKPFEEKFRELSSRFASVSHKGAITFGKEGEALEKEKNGLIDKICSLAAEKVLGVEPSQRPNALYQSLDLLRSSFSSTYSLAPGVRNDFIEKTLFKAIELAEAKK